MIAFTTSNGGIKWGTDYGLSNGSTMCRPLGDGLYASIYTIHHKEVVRLDSEGVWVEHTIDTVPQTTYQMFQDTLKAAGFSL